MNRQPDFEALLQALPDPCVVLSADLRVHAANDVFLTTTGVHREDLLERRLLDDVFPDPDGDGEAAQGRRGLRASIAVATKTATVDVADMHRYDLPTGPGGKRRKRYWSVINSPIVSADGTVQHLSMRVQDVTAARGLLAATVGRLSTVLGDGQPSIAGQLQSFAEYLTDAQRRGGGVQDILGQVDELLTVLQARTVIEQAKGMLMATQRISADQAYALLRQESQHTNMKLRDVAAHHVAVRSAPPRIPLTSPSIAADARRTNVA